MIGTVLQNRYRIDAELGQGGMGVVYRGYDILLGRDVAIKVLSKASSTGLNTEGRARLLHEAQAAAKLNHPNIVSIYDAGEAEDRLPFIVMELVMGESLFDRAPQSIGETLTVTRQICVALEHAHGHKIVHRDLKPENIIVTQDRTVKLTDFGLARSLSTRLTQQGLIVGTVFYLAPEAALGGVIDGRADLYSLGVILYELVTGSLPFTADDPLAVISQHLYAPLVPPRARKPEIPAPLNDLIVKLLSKQPEDRPASAAEVRHLLEILQSMGQVEPARSTPVPELPVLDRLVRGRFIGRECELADLSAAWATAAAGEGQLVLVSGEPGIGKTRLVRELMARVAVSGGRTLLGNCYAEGGIPFAPFPEMMADTLGAIPGSLNLPDFVLADLIAIAPELRARFPQVKLSAAPELQAEQTRIFESVFAWLAALASQAPVLLFVDDIHWADSGTLHLLRHLARRARRLPVLIVMTYREVELNDASALQQVLSDFSRERLATRLKLTRFDRELTRAMLAAILSPAGEIDASLVDAIYRETEGNPYFIEEVTRALIEEGKLCVGEVCWVAGDPAEIEIPQSVRLTVQSRLARLPAETQDVLRMAAILGREFDFETLRQASDLDEDALIEALEKAEQSQIITELPRRRAKSLSFSFAHALIPSTLRDSLSGLRRQRLHRRAAVALEAAHPETNGRSAQYEFLAYHYEQAGDAERAKMYYARAGERALAVFAYQEAERYYRAALELCDDEVEQTTLLASLGEALFRQGLYEGAIDTWNRAISGYRTAGDAENIARLYARSARAAWHGHDAPRGLALCREGLSVVQSLSPSPEPADGPGIATLLHETARALRFNGQNEEALPLCQRALEMARRLGLVEIQAESLATLGILPDQEPEAARQALVEAVELAEAAGLMVVASRAHLNLGGHLQGLGRFEEARQHTRQASELARGIGMVDWEFNFLSAAVDMSLELADFTDVEAKLPTLRRLAAQLPNPVRQQAIAGTIEGVLLLRRGEWAEAVQRLRACQANIRQLGDLHFLRDINTQLGMAYIELERLEQAAAVLEEALGIEAEKPETEKLFPIAMSTVLRLDQGRVAEASLLVEQAWGIYAARPVPVARVGLDWIQARLAAAEGRLDDSLASFDGVVRQAEEFGMRWYAAVVIQDWAAAHLARNAPGDPARARELYHSALKIFEEIGSPGYAARIKQRLQTSA